MMSNEEDNAIKLKAQENNNNNKDQQKSGCC